MIFDILKETENIWRDIIKLATPIDSDKKVNLGTKPKQGDFEAYTDNKSIFINVNEKKFRKNFKDKILPVYANYSNKLYGIPNSISGLELLSNLVSDNFLFVYFHEQLHPWLCPNSKEDRKKISKSLYEGIKKAEPSLSKSEVLLKTNNSKNLIWDVILNISFLKKTSSDSKDTLSEKIKFVFNENERKIGSNKITSYPKGILPILYLISAQNRTTDAPISLIGDIYSTLSFNNSEIRKKAIDFFLEDLESKKISETKAKEIIKKMYKGFIDEIKEKELQTIGIDKEEFQQKVSYIDNLTNPDYEKNQKYFISTLTKIFDTPSMRYNSLKGFIKVLSPFISLSEKQGSPDPNTNGGGSGEPGESKDSKDKSQNEMNEESKSETLDDLLDELSKKEANDLMEDIANSDKARGSINIAAIDEYYKRNSEIIEMKNPSHEKVSFDAGKKQRWKMVRSNTITPAEVSKLNHQKIMIFQKTTGLPVLIETGGGFFKLNEYRLEETIQKSYNFQKTGIEIPDNWVLFQDSSGTMTSTTGYVGSKNRFDLLNRVKYGIQKGLYQICKEMKKDLKFGIVDFSDITIYRGIDSLIKIYESRDHPIKKVSLTPQCSSTVLNEGVFKRIEKDLSPGKTIYTFITDGELQGDTDALYKRIKEFASKPQNAFAFVEIASHTNFGGEIKRLSKANSSVLYYPVSTVQSIKDKLGSILIKYE